MKKELWLRLKDYHFENVVPSDLLDHVAAAFGGRDASTKAFANKVARKLGWAPAFALRAIDEYRKFVYLGMVSDFPVTPPKHIDQVWHEHILFSRAYREFCRDVLHRDFDHNPELVPTRKQTSTFQDQYEATRALYRSEFGVEPPAHIWGTPKFSASVRQARQARHVPAKKRRASELSTSSGDAPLYSFFGGSSDGGTHHEMAEFGGGGEFSGGGGESSWGGSSSDSASDGGSSDGGGSGCSSGCGGGGE